MTRKYTKKRSALISGALVTGGMVAGAMFAPLSLASAQTDEDDSTTPDSTDEGVQDGQSRRSERREALAEFLGLSVEDLAAAKAEDQTLVQIAEANGVSEADLLDYLVAQADDKLDAKVAEGELTAEEAAERSAEIEERLSERINTPASEREGRGGRGSRGNGAVRGAVSEVLGELGITAEEIQEGRAAGQTLAEIAAANGVAEADLVQAFVDSAEERIAAKVEDGSIDAERAAEISEGLEDKITEKVNSEPGERGERGRRGGTAPDADGADAEADLDA